MPPQPLSSSNAEQLSRRTLPSVVRQDFIAVALFVMLAVTGAAAQVQPPSFPPGFQRRGQHAATDPAESSAYQAALAQQNPSDRIAALQQFLGDYPNSAMRQTAIAALMATQRQMQGAPDDPAVMNRPLPSPAPPAAPSAPAPALAPSYQPAGPTRDSLLQQAPKQAQITVAPPGLTIKADNSALSQILHDIAGTTGMKIDGLSKDERIFGTYGPGAARDVLLTLLEGSGYNVVMIGDLASGTPRELSLSQRASTASSNAGPAPRTSSEEDADDEQEVQQVSTPQEPQPPQNAPPGQENGQPPPTRSPQEILQELQRLRQQNQNQPPPQNPQ
jgi:hypothetical protein